MSGPGCEDLSGGQEEVWVLFKGSTSTRPPEFQYSPDNVQGPGCVVDPSEVTLPGCSCSSHSCSPESCFCLQTHGQSYDAVGKLLTVHRASSAHCSPVFECSALCSCSGSCSNRVVQRGLQRRLEVFSTRDRGWGVRTLEGIPQGTFVCEYAGEVIGYLEARRRQLTQTSKDNNYIIAVREHAGTGSITETFVDPAKVGNVGHFLNHSCSPNLFMLPVRTHSLVPQLALFAGGDIGANEELTFDYSGGFSDQSRTQREDVIKDKRTDGPQRKVCHCGATNCMKLLPLDFSILS